MFDTKVTVQLLLILSVSCLLIVAVGGAFGLVDPTLFIKSLISLGAVSAILGFGLLLCEI
jgi:hypothetical protein